MTASKGESRREPYRPVADCCDLAFSEPTVQRGADGRGSPQGQPTPTRRSLLQRGIGLGGVGLIGGIAGCARGGEAIGDLADDDGAVTATESDMALQEGLQIGLGSTAFAGLAGPSEVDPDEPGGGRLVTVEAVSPADEVRLSWRETIERELTPEETPTAGVGEETPTPETEIVERTGMITASGLDDAHRPFLPMYWEPGDSSTDSSAIWLSESAFTELRETRETAWSRDVLTRISRLGEEAVEKIDTAAQQVDEVTLQAEAEFEDFELALDGQERTVQAIAAYDSFGNAYRILDEPANPLILKFTYDAVSTGFAGIDAGLWSLIKTVFSGYRVASIDRPN